MEHCIHPHGHPATAQRSVPPLPSPQPPYTPRSLAEMVAERLRRHRRARKMRLRELALELDTTPQTVQRLETGQMTLSLEWLFKLCAVLEVDPATLFKTGDDIGIPVVGTLGRTNTVEYVPPSRQMIVSLGSQCVDRVAIRLSADIADYKEGDLLIASPIDRFPANRGNWGHCLVSADNSPLRLMHVLQDQRGDWVLVSPGQERDVEFAKNVHWLAQVNHVVRQISAPEQGVAQRR